MPIAAPFARPLYVMLKPASADCNLACDYCYYLEKKHTLHDKTMLSDALLEAFVVQYIEAQTMPQVLFTWHGGEPLLRPLSFYERALKLQQKHANGHQIDNCLQTNGTLLTDNWCRFLRDNHFLVGISIDGPQPLHDAFRHDRRGQPTWERVMHGIELLQKHGVEWNAMATVNRVNADHPVDFYRFFKQIGCQFLQFTPVVERKSSRGSLLAGTEHGGELTDFSVTPAQWGHFLCRVYDEWVQHDVGSLFVQMFDATLANWAGVAPSLCSLGTSCAHNAVMEADGSIYACDHFVFPKYRLGHLSPATTAATPTLTTLLYGPRQQAFGRKKTETLPRQCRECRFLFACHGECPRNRFNTDRYGNRGLNYLCEGYHRFFTHVAADMEFMLGELRNGRSPANIMRRQKK
mgnify:FL=1